MLQAKIPEPVENKRPDIVEYLDSLLSQYNTSIEGLRYLKYERGFGFDALGNGLIQKDGSDKDIRFKTKEEKELLRKCDTFLHNHPVEDFGLSRGDIKVAISLGLSRVIAVTGKHIYILHLPELELYNFLVSSLVWNAYDTSEKLAFSSKYSSWENRGHLFTKIFADMIPGCRYEVITL